MAGGIALRKIAFLFISVCLCDIRESGRNGAVTNTTETTPKILIDRLSGLGREKRVEKGEVLLLQGQTLTHIGLMVSGYTAATSYHENGTATWLSRFQPGDFFGHSAFFSQTKMQFEVKAERSARIRLIAISQIEKLLKDDPALAAAFAQDLARRLNAINLRLAEALTLSAKGRICAELLRMSNPIGITPEKSVIRPNPVFVDMALRVSSTRETVSRTMSDLQKEGIVTRQAGAIIIQRPADLKKAVK